MVLRVIGPLADPFRAIDQALLDVVADGPPRQLGEGRDFVHGELLRGAHKHHLYDSHTVTVNWLVLVAPWPQTESAGLAAIETQRRRSDVADFGSSPTAVVLV